MFNNFMYENERWRKLREAKLTKHKRKMGKVKGVRRCNSRRIIEVWQWRYEVSWLGIQMKYQVTGRRQKLHH